MKKVKIHLLLIPALLFLLSCNQDKLKIDISNIETDINLYKLNDDLFSINQDSIWDEIYLLSERYGLFWDLYTHQIIEIGGANDKEFANLLTSFINDPVIYDSHKESEKIFPDLQSIKDEIENAFKHFKYYFPDKSIPDIYSFIGGFNQSIVTDTDIIGIGLDKYYGKDCNFYGQLQIPVYVRQMLDAKYIVNDCMQAWGYMEFGFEDSLGYLVSTMIYEGKILYFVNSMTPDQPESHFIKYTDNQQKWCESNEKEMWKYLIEHKLLFSTDYKEVVRFTQDGPFTAAFSQDSPGKAGIWIGYQIVKGYMENNEDVSLQELMVESDYQKILNFSRYNP